ncbi:MAG: 6-bladed beta-propeller [Bacteroidales bacterium]|nr:6-bladed beta-propeller [Bacteroidales bacterium]MDD4656537.1 6-bladed beta-propeller [Bacteroidales bacterium]
MEKKILTAVLYVVFVLANSCSGGSSVNELEEVKTISLEPLVGNEQVVRLSEIASKVEYIPLETTQESLLGNVMYTSLENDHFYVPDFTINKISRFSLDGKYRGSVGSHGRAFGEFLSITSGSFDYDYETDAQMVRDMYKLIEYHKDGSIKETKLDKFRDKSFNSSFIQKHGDIYICSIFKLGTNSNNLIFLDLDGNLIGEFPQGYETEEYKEREPKGDGAAPTPFAIQVVPQTYRYNNLLMIINSSCDRITAYKPSDTLGYPAYNIDYGSYTEEVNGQKRPIIKMIAGFTKESQKHLFLTFNFGMLRSAKNSERLTRVLFDKESGETKSLIGKIENDIDGGISFWPQYVSRDGKMVAIIQAFDFIEAAKESNSAYMKEIAATLTEESNPVVMLVTQ